MLKGKATLWEERLDGESKIRIRSFLWQYLVNSYGRMPPYVWNKLIVTFVLIGKVEYPSNFNEFLPSVLNLLKVPEVVIVMFGICVSVVGDLRFSIRVSRRVR